MGILKDLLFLKGIIWKESLYCLQEIRREDVIEVHVGQLNLYKRIIPLLL